MLKKEVRVRVCKGSREPIPRVGDKWISSFGAGRNQTYIIGYCDCLSIKGTGWPNGNRCGAHLNDLSGEYAGSIVYLGTGKWLKDGELIRSEDTVSIDITAKGEEVFNLKERNTNPGAIKCCICGGALKNPFPPDNKYKHCPVCEP